MKRKLRRNYKLIGIVLRIFPCLLFYSCMFLERIYLSPKCFNKNFTIRDTRDKQSRCAKQTISTTGLVVTYYTILINAKRQVFTPTL